MSVYSITFVDIEDKIEATKMPSNSKHNKKGRFILIYHSPFVFRICVLCHSSRLSIYLHSVNGAAVYSFFFVCSICVYLIGWV